MDNKIEKIINYCWFGKNKKNKTIEKCIESWKRVCPDYKIIEWNEDNFDININKYVQQAYENKKWAFVSDFARLYIIYNYGGIYLDTDVELVKKPDELLKFNSFFATEDNKNINTGLGFGAQKNSEIILHLMNDYNNLNFINDDGSFDLQPCTFRNSKSLEKFLNQKIEENLNISINNTIILSKEFFCPFNSKNGVLEIESNTIGIHWFDASWRNQKINFRRNLLRPIKRLVGLENFEKIKQVIFGKEKNKFNDKSVAVVTLFDNNNYGNRLQSFAVYTVLNKLKMNPIYLIESENSLHKILKKIFKRSNDNINIERKYLFEKFTQNIQYSKSLYGLFRLRLSKKNQKKYYKFIVGSDQVWNVGKKGINSIYLLSFAPKYKRVSFAASFGISNFPEKFQKNLKNELNFFDKISVREDAGRNIIKDVLGKDVEVLIDPTMLLNASDWDAVSCKPKQYNGEKYILNYFLGYLSDDRRKEIEKIANMKKCKIINLLDPNDPYYISGPSEFLWLEKNAELICTDSFHSSVFAIIYDKPFIVYKREDKKMSMNSRIETLVRKFNLKNREYNEKNITEENLNHDYTEAYKILEVEREKSNNFLKRALDIEK